MIGARRHEDASALLGLILDAASGRPGGGLCLESDAGARVFALVTPLPNLAGVGAGHALVALRSANGGPDFGADLLCRLFRLTQAEAEVALALLSDRSSREILEKRDVTENTLRTQVASVLRKTDTHSQRDLVRLLSLLPPVLES